MRRRLGVIIGSFVGALVLAGCGADSGTASTTLASLSPATDFRTIPTTSTTLSAAVATNADGSPATSAATDVYTVKAGDYPLKVAQLFGCPWEKIAGYNDLAPDKFPFPGQTLQIPFDCTPAGQPAESTAPPASSQTPTATSSSAPPTTSKDGAGSYTIVAGDTVYGIAKKFNTTADALAKINGWSDGIKHPLYPGDKIKVPAPG